MNRRSFLIGLGSTSLITSVPMRSGGVEGNDSMSPITFWDTQKREENMLRIAERVVPDSDPEQLTMTPSDLNDPVPVYELYQSDPAGTPFVNWLIDNDFYLMPSDIAVRAYVISDRDEAGPAYPHFIDGAAIAIPSRKTDELVAAVTGWEDDARTLESNTKSEAVITHNRGLSRYMSFTDPLGFRVQRIRILGNRMLITWVEGEYGDDESCHPLLAVQRIENGILLRRLQAYLDEGNTIPAEPIVLERSRWEQ